MGNNAEHSANRIDPVGIETWIRQRIGGIANQPMEQIPPDADFQSFGIDSARAVSIAMDLEEWLGLTEELPLELLFEASSIRAAAQSIAAAAQRMRESSDKKAVGQ